MKVIQCPCGHIMRAPSHDEVVRVAQLHAREVHGMDLSAKEALSMARPEQA
jgi:predicted small metal-binding protein